MNATWLGLSGALAATVAVAGCSSPATPKGPGGQCFLLTDCAKGLFCVTQADGSRRCSRDLSPTVQLPEGGAAVVDAAQDSLAPD